MNKQSGFAVVEIVLALVMVAAIGFSVFAYNNHQAAKEQTASNLATSIDVADAPQINSLADLTTAKQALSNLDENAGDTDVELLDGEASNF